MARDWTQQETTYLKRHAKTKQLAELAERFDTEPGEVQAHLDALGLQAGASTGPALVDSVLSRLEAEPLLGDYEKALEAFHDGGEKKREQAAKLFRKVVEECDQPELAARARQYLDILERDVADEPTDDADPFLRAVFEKNRGNLAEALEIAEEGPDDEERYVYLRASVHALDKRLDEAAEWLARAIEIDDKNRVYAFHDPDFEGLRASEDHAEIFDRE